ncbi:uncharacterized protein ACNLHF_018348 isoform 2-T2 [Anomaloglossus baeobatrachus]
MARIVVLGVLCSLTECLEVTTSAPQPVVLVDGDILLHCHFTLLELIRVEDVAVKWTVRGSGGALRLVYTFDGDKINSLRPKSSIDHRLLETGNASLYLPNLTLEDEGEYTCTVLISPEVGEASLVLRLAAQPTVGLLPEDPHVTSGEMKTFICKLSHFYPQDLEIKWIMKKEKREMVLTKDICSGVPFQGDNGTFTADSQVSILFTEEDDGSVIMCEVRHQSLPQPLTRDTAIHLTVVPASGRTALTVSAVLMATAIIVTTAILYWKFLASECLEVTTSAPQPVVLVDGDILLHCHFTLLELIRVEDVAVKWTVRGSCGALRLVYTFDGDKINSLRPKSSIDHRLLETGNASLYLPNLTLEDEGEYTCTVLISPEVGEASLVLRLAAQPTVGLLPEDPHVTSGEMKTFICKLSHFYPQDLEIKWIMKKEKREMVLTKDICSGVPFQGDNGTFTADSQVSILFTEEDDGSVIVCEVRHQSLPQPLTRDTAIHLTVVPASGRTALTVSAVLMATAIIVTTAILYWKFLASARPKKSYITSWPQDPRMGGKLTLSCIVERFYPKPIKITWLRNGQVQSGATQFGPFPCEDDYYSVWSQIDLTVTEEEVGVMYTCQINHISLRGIEELSYEVNAQGTPPEVQFISADPVAPIIGKELLLSCRINNFFPRDIMVDWSKDGVKLEAGVCHSLCVTTTSGVHSMWSFLTITPAAEDDGAVFTCSVQHTALKHPEERTYTLSVPAQNHSI